MNDDKWPAYDSANKGEGVLVIYTGGTIGSMPRDPGDPQSPLVTVDWAEFRRRTSSLNDRLADGSRNLRYIGFNVDGCSMRPLDSCNIGPGYWVEVSRVIEQSYDRYEGFVVLHGTDTMVYTASALSFMLEGLGKPVVLTGAQRSHLAQRSQRRASEPADGTAHRQPEALRPAGRGRGDDLLSRGVTARQPLPQGERVRLRGVPLAELPAAGHGRREHRHRPPRRPRRRPGAAAVRTRGA